MARRSWPACATGRYIGEGFDDPRLDTLFLTLPISWRGTVAQYAGRLHRLHEGKRDVRVYDYADDLLLADARVAIDLDGPQHLLDPAAYRRDRRKDRLLQEQGYLVLRFLAEDVAKDLNAVLDSILRVLATRTRRE